MADLLLQIITLTANFALFIFLVYYFMQLRHKEREIDKIRGKVDIDYHQVVDNALTKERKILEDATREANQIISQAQYIRQSSKETVEEALQKMVTDIHREASTTTQSVDSSLEKMTSDIHTEAVNATKTFLHTYTASLSQISQTSLNEYQKVMKELEGDLQKQTKELHDKLLPNLEKELQEFKTGRLQRAELTINAIVQKVSQEVLNKTISLEDHKNLIIASLEKAKKDGGFD